MQTVKFVDHMERLSLPVDNIIGGDGLTPEKPRNQQQRKSLMRTSDHENVAGRSCASHRGPKSLQERIELRFSQPCGTRFTVSRTCFQDEDSCIVRDIKER